MNWEIASEEDLREVAKWIISQMGDVPVFLLEGELGSGKTTLVRYVCEALQTADTVQSPTFSIIHEYHFKGGPPGLSGRLYHMDMYRVKNLVEALRIGIEDYLSGVDMCFIEWPEIIYPILHEPYLRIQFEVMPDGHRKIRILNHLRMPEELQKDNG